MIFYTHTHTHSLSLPLSQVISSLKRALQPSVTDLSLELKVPPSVEVQQAQTRLPTVLNGDKTIIFGVFKPKEKSVSLSCDMSCDVSCEAILRGIVLGKPIVHHLSFQVPMAPQSGGGGDILLVHHLAAKSLIADWQGGEALSGLSATERKEAMVRLSVESSVVSQHTAYVLVDEGQSVPAQGAIKTWDITAKPTPHSWCGGGSGVFGLSSGYQSRLSLDFGLFLSPRKRHTGVELDCESCESSHHQPFSIIPSMCNTYYYGSGELGSSSGSGDLQLSFNLPSITTIDTLDHAQGWHRCACRCMEQTSDGGDGGDGDGGDGDECVGGGSGLPHAADLFGGQPVSGVTKGSLFAPQQQSSIAGRGGFSFGGVPTGSFQSPPSASQQPNTAALFGHPTRVARGSSVSYPLSMSYGSLQSQEQLAPVQTMGFNAHRAPSSQQGSLQLVLLQQIDGSWALDAALASILGRSVPDLEAACPVRCDGDMRTIWATVLAVEYLEIRHGAQRDEWELVAMKAESWLQGHSQSADLSTLKQAAKRCL